MKTEKTCHRPETLYDGITYFGTLIDMDLFKPEH